MSTNIDVMVQGFGALSAPLRVSILRILAKAGPDGLASGDIARRLDAPATSISTQLSLLLAAGLLEQERVGKNVFYKTNPEGMKKLIKLLVLECAGGRLRGVKLSA